jgi:hypothetical protein
MLYAYAMKLWWLISGASAAQGSVLLTVWATTVAVLCVRCAVMYFIMECHLGA